MKESKYDYRFLVIRSVTNRLINWIQETSFEKTFTNVADDIGVDEKAVRNNFVVELEAQTDIRTPKWLGIDEVHLLKNYRCVITDVENKYQLACICI
ncbi:hypothetical protein GCM10008934_16920 [Virgibacillus salarius]